jgi:hypothetical protein
MHLYAQKQTTNFAETCMHYFELAADFFPTGINETVHCIFLLQVIVCKDEIRTNWCWDFESLAIKCGICYVKENLFGSWKTILIRLAQSVPLILFSTKLNMLTQLNMMYGQLYIAPAGRSVFVMLNLFNLLETSEKLGK